MLSVYLTQIFLLLAVFNGTVFAKKGGGGSDSDSDSNGSSSGSSSGSDDGNSDSDNSSGGVGSSRCGSETPSNALSTTYLVPRNAWNWTSQSGAYSTANPTIYDGSYFQGEGTLSYNMTSGTRCENAKQLRILGYAWIGPQPPYPKGAHNPFIIGFKAWQSDKAVSEIYTAYDQIKWDGDLCPSQPDLFRITTTRSSASNDETSDTMSLDISPNPTLPGAIQFNATTATGLDPPISDDVGLFRLRAGTCTSSTTDMHWPDTTSMQGSVTNTTMDLTISGSVDMNSTQYQHYSGRDEDLKVDFKLTFSGTFDSANSTHAVDIEHADQSITWVPNTAGSIFSAGLGYLLVWTLCVRIMTLKMW